MNKGKDAPPTSKERLEALRDRFSDVLEHPVMRELYAAAADHISARDGEDVAGR